MYFQQFKNIWDNAEHNTGERMIGIDKAFNVVNKSVIFKSPATNFWFYWKKVTAIILIPLVLGNLLYFSFLIANSSTHHEPIYNELFAAFSTRFAFKLCDGTSVWLNSGSSIKYPDRFIGNNRTVFLNCEAYFEVESDYKKPFIVKSSFLSVKARGTKVNVSGYASANEEEVTLVTGKEDVNLTDYKKNIKSSTLDINQHFSLNIANIPSSRF